MRRMVICRVEKNGGDQNDESFFGCLMIGVWLRDALRCFGVQRGIMTWGGVGDEAFERLRFVFFN